MDLVVDDLAVLDLNGFSPTVSSLNSSYAAPGAVNGKIIDSSESGNTTLTVDATGVLGVFAGEILNGVGLGLASPGGGCQLVMTLTGDNPDIGMITTEGTVRIGDGNESWSLDGSVRFNSAYADVVFDVGVGDTGDFSGQIIARKSLNSFVDGGALEKIGAGTLDLSGNTASGYANSYNGPTCIEGGTLQLENAAALTANAGLIVDNGATFDLNGNSFAGASELNSVTLNNGMIIDTTQTGASLQVTNLIEVAYGSISAGLTGPATLLKSEGFGSGLTGVPADTVILAGTCDANGLTGTAYVDEGELIVDGTLGAPVTVAPGGSLGGTGTCSGPVTVWSGGTLSLGAATGPATIIVGQLTLDTGSFVNDDVGGQDTYLMGITGPLAIERGVTLNVHNEATFVPYQVLFQFGSLGNPDSFANFRGSNAGADLINNTPASSIDLASVAAKTLYWAPNGALGGTGNWDGSTLPRGAILCHAPANRRFFCRTIIQIFHAARQAAH